MKTKLGDIFNLLSWNIYKVDHKDRDHFENYIQKINHALDVDIYCLQESKYKDQISFPINGFYSYFAANIQLKKHAYGVTTATNSKSLYAKPMLTQYKESVINTHKVSLLTCHSFNDNEELIVINLHAINFRSTKIYVREFKKIEALIGEYKDSRMVIAGDFNTWNRKRIKYIKYFCRKKGFKIAFLDNHQYVKKFANNPLDFVLYKNLKVLQAKALYFADISDHNPIFVRFLKI